MVEHLRRRIIGQDEAVLGVSRAVKTARVGLKDPKRPIGSFFFLGPTGVGKTELAKALAEFMFGTEEAMIVLDMSEYQDENAVNRLIGAPPGYVGYEAGGQLTDKVATMPYSVVLFDEAEKAHRRVLDVLLQIMEEGTLSDAKGRKVDFRNAILVLTSNIGAELIKQQGGMGFAIPQDEEEDAQHDYEEMRNTLIEELKRTFRPEFINRVDSVIVFHALSKENIAQIVDLELDKVRERLAECNAELEVTDAAKALLAEQGYSDEYGARPLKRVIQNQVEDALSDAILECRFGEGEKIIVDAEEDEILLRKQTEPSEELVPA